MKIKGKVITLFVIFSIIFCFTTYIIIYKNNGKLKADIDVYDDKNSIDNVDSVDKIVNSKLQAMSLEEKIAQMYVVGALESDYENMYKYNFGGYLYFEDFFDGKSKDEITKEIQSHQNKVSNGIELITAIDEEGAVVSRLNNLPFIKEKFKDSWELYNEGGLEKIEEELKVKNELLKALGINVNFAPVLDISSENAWIYNRTLKQDAKITSEYAKHVINVTKDSGVTYCVKHFPGYGNSVDTHLGFATDNRTREEFNSKDLLPFKSAIDSGAEMVMVTHNLITCMDDKYPASISLNVHKILRDELGFKGLIITDALNMGAIYKKYSTKEAIIHAINSGNDLICISLAGYGKKDEVENAGNLDLVTYDKLIVYVKEAIEEGKVKEDTIDNAVKRILKWKYDKHLLNI